MVLSGFSYWRNLKWIVGLFCCCFNGYLFGFCCCWSCCLLLEKLKIFIPYKVHFLLWTYLKCCLYPDKGQPWLRILRIPSNCLQFFLAFSHCHVYFTSVPWKKILSQNLLFKQLWMKFIVLCLFINSFHILHCASKKTLVCRTR